MEICVIYLDDIIIFSETYEEHLERIDLVISRLKAANLKLGPDKCHFFLKKVHFLGHIVSGEGIETDPAKIEKVKNWPSPANSDELRSFLAFAGYYRRFVKDFSKLTRPLSELLPPTVGKKERGKRVAKTPWRWTDLEQDVFNRVKEILASPPILAYPDFKQPFELHTDASTKALGAVLYQTQGDRKRVIAYASRALNKAERNYCAFKLEFLALKWSVTEKFKEYLACNHFSVLTDNNPLTYVLTTAKLDATGQRWAAALGKYSFDITYRAGIRNADADGLSRYPYERLTDGNEDQVRLEDNTIKAICSCTTIQMDGLIHTLPSLSINIVESIGEPGQMLAQKELKEIRRQQRNDTLIDRWRCYVIDGRFPEKHLRKEDLAMRKQFKSFFVRRGILFRKVKNDTEEIEQLVLPEVYREEVLRGLHSDIGHPGTERTIRLIRERFFWPGMLKDVEQWVKTCDRCLKRKDKLGQRAPMVSIHTKYPLELVCMDYLSLEPAHGIGNILIITDHFTKFAVAIPTKNQTAKTVAEVFYDQFICRYGIPTKLHTDQGANFESHLIRELCNIMGMRKSHTTPYHPQGNAGPERFNRTLLEMLGTMDNHKKDNWKKYVQSLVYFYNCTPHESARVSPFELMFGRKPRLPVDTVFQNAREQPIPNRATEEYVQELKERMDTTRKIVEERTMKAKNKQKHYYDRKARSVEIAVGDKVLVKKVSFDGKHKIADRYEEEVYTVVEQPRRDIPVYRIKSGDMERTLHKNLLYLLESHIRDSDGEDRDVGRRSQKEDENQIKDIEGDVTSDPDSEEECGLGHHVTNQDGDAHISDTRDLAVDETRQEVDEAREEESDDEVEVRDEARGIEPTADEVEVRDEARGIEPTADDNDDVNIISVDRDHAIEIIDDRPNDDIVLLQEDQTAATDVVIEHRREEDPEDQTVEEPDDENQHAEHRTGDVDEVQEQETTEPLDEAREGMVNGDDGETTEETRTEETAEADSTVNREEPVRPPEVRPEPTPRRSIRERRPPARYGDYVMSTIVYL